MSNATELSTSERIAFVSPTAEQTGPRHQTNQAVTRSSIESPAIEPDHKTARSTPSKTKSNWEKLIYIDDENEACVDLIVDGVNRNFSVQDLVCLVYHGPRSAPYSVSHVIDTSKPCTPDNVGWLSQKAARLDQRTGSSTTKEIKRPLKRPKQSVKWNALFKLNGDGALYLEGQYKGQWKQYLVADYLSEAYRGPWPALDSYAFIIDLSKPCTPDNVGWMTQNPEFRTVKYG